MKCLVKETIIDQIIDQMKGRKIFEVTIILISIIVLFSLPLHLTKTKKELRESGKHIILYRNYSTFHSAFLIINGVIDMVILSF